MKSPKFRNVSFSEKSKSEVIQHLSTPIDLEKELLIRDFPIASHGRIDWTKLPKASVHKYSDDQNAAEIIIETIRDNKLDGTVMVVWTDAGIRPVTMEIGIVCNYAFEICIEDWDCWIISITNKWVIEKYHDGEVCFANTENA